MYAPGTRLAQRPPVEFAIGESVRVRGARWTVDEVTTFDDCAMLCLSTIEADVTPRICRLLLPFDRPVKLTGRSRPRAVSPRRWMRYLLGTLSEVRAYGQLRAVSGAAIDILPFQLEPALALIAGRASRFLLADEVGLGKTIQAGLMLAELQERGWCDRALILTPAGLRRQWADELWRRFHIRAAVVDAAALSALTNSLPIDVNPWGVEPVAIASIDFVKQPEVLRALQRQLWDMLIVDEAHQATAASLRYEAVETLAARSRHVVLLTATPHAGDDPAYRALCGLGGLDRADRLVLFRRTRQQAGLERTRRVHLLPVLLTPQALSMHRLLARYVARLWDIAKAAGRRDVQLVAMVLSKRAFSSATSLAASIERRLAGLSGSPMCSPPVLPFDIDSDSSDEPPDEATPAFEDGNEERRMLREVLHAARAAEQDERKVRAVQRLIRRVREPLIVFTEYRDTLDTLRSALGDLRTIATLHGAKTAEERRNAVDEFTSGRADLLLATDAGAEGLNLHDRCRLVVNLELPWNPIRLEQRIGRVDRIGQTRTVHAINLFAQGTPESTVLARLLRRLDRIQASEIEVAASVIRRAELPPRTDAGKPPGHADTVDLSHDAADEATRIRAVRTRARLFPGPAENRIPVTLLRSASARSPFLRSLHHTLIWFVRVRIANGAGRLVEDAVVAVATPLRGRLRWQDVRLVAKHAIAEDAPRIVAFVSRLTHDRTRWIERQVVGWTSRALTRERHLCEMAGSGAPALIQPGLFDNRAVKGREAASQARRCMIEGTAARAHLLEAGATAAPAHEPQIALLLVVRPKPRR